jgi:preprotein translocase subunit Sec61beta
LSFLSFVLVLSIAVLVLVIVARSMQPV